MDRTVEFQQIKTDICFYTDRVNRILEEELPRVQKKIDSLKIILGDTYCRDPNNLKGLDALKEDIFLQEQGIERLQEEIKECELEIEKIKNKYSYPDFIRCPHCYEEENKYLTCWDEKPGLIHKDSYCDVCRGEQKIYFPLSDKKDKNIRIYFLCWINRAEDYKEIVLPIGVATNDEYSDIHNIFLQKAYDRLKKFYKDRKDVKIELINDGWFKFIQFTSKDKRVQYELDSDWVDVFDYNTKMTYS